MTTATELALLRLVALRVAGPPPADAAAAVRLLTCLQGQDLPGALTSVALRTAQRTRAGVEAALEAGEVVRSWPMRSTLHLVPAEDLHWLLELCGPRVLAGAARRRAVLGTSEADLERARDLVTAALGGGRRCDRRELLDAVADGGVATTGQRGYHLLWWLAQTGTLCLGPVAGGEQQFVLLDEWVPAARRLDRDAALAELALRYLRGQGPDTVRPDQRARSATVAGPCPRR